MAFKTEKKRALCERIARETGLSPEDVDKVLKASYIDTMEFVIDRIKQELSASRAKISLRTIEQLKTNPMVCDKGPVY